jgi:putative intracellular protease/amidase
MKKSRKVLIVALSTLIMICTVLYFRLQPVWKLGETQPYRGNADFDWKFPAFDRSKKTVIIVADNDGTEIFDLMAPFYLFNATEKANVYIVAEQKYPIILAKGLFILPHLTFHEADSLKIHPDVIVIPNQSVKPGKRQKPATVNWIKSHYTGTNIILSVCDGSATAAATGLYDGKALTTHSSDFERIKKHYPAPAWVKNVCVTQSGNLFSTAGVSNATEGSLTVINEIFGRETMQKVLNDIHYPHPEIITDHESLVVDEAAIFTGLSKVLFRKNYKIGVLLKDNINEIELAGLLDTYARTVPASIESFVTRGYSIKSKYGLTIFPTGVFTSQSFDEVHVLMPDSSGHTEQILWESSQVVNYDHHQRQYAIDKYLARISTQYGSKFQHLVKLMLDYN